jgi:hypothetical protein
LVIFHFRGEITMRRSLLAIAMLVAGLGLSACKFESMSAFDNNCSGNSGIYNEAHCANFGT